VQHIDRQSARTTILFCRRCAYCPVVRPQRNERKEFENISEMIQLSVASTEFLVFLQLENDMFKIILSR